MAMRRIVFRFDDGAEIVDVLGCDFTLLAAFLKYYGNDRILSVALEIDGQLSTMSVIGGNSVEGYLNRWMKIFVAGQDSGILVKFI